MDKNLQKRACLSAAILCMSLWIGIIFLVPPALACTLWSASGDSLAGGGILISKNRDWAPNHQQHLELSTIRDSGYRYLGLIATGNDSPGLKAGVNTKGLVVVTASPPSYMEKDKSLPRVLGVARKILADCKTVKQALSRREWFVGPQFIMLADPDEIAIVEIGLDGKFRVKSTKSGVLSCTNHYIEPDLVDLNRGKPGVSSVKRLDKIHQFLASKDKFSLEDFIQISTSTDAGADNSLWRTGSKPTSNRTLATWMIYQPNGGEFQLYLKLANPGKEIKEYRYQLKDIFANKVDLSGVK